MRVPTLAQWGLLVEIAGFLLFAAQPLHGLLKGPRTRARRHFEAAPPEVHNFREGTLPPERAWPEKYRPLERYYIWVTRAEVLGVSLIVAGLVLQGWPWL